MNLRYDSATAHKLLSDIANTNNKLNIVGNELLATFYITGWQDIQRDRLQNVISNTVKVLVSSIDSLESYRKSFASAVAKLEE